jgi:hypothetical protein
MHVLKETCIDWREIKLISNLYMARGFGGLVVSMLASGTQDRGF